MLAVGLFVEHDHVMNLNKDQVGLFKGGGAYCLGIQALSCLCVITWSALTSLILLMVSSYSSSMHIYWGCT